MEGASNPFYQLYQVLLSHQGPIHEFTLNIDTIDEYPFEFDQILQHLSKNHPVWILALNGMDSDSWDNLPESVFSMHQLMDLHLSCFCIYYEPELIAFSNLRRLALIDIRICTKTLLDILSNCPLLKSLRLILGSSHLGPRYCTIIRLFECLPKIEYLSTSDDVFEWLVPDSVPQELPALLPQLDYFRFKKMKFDDGHGFAFLHVLMKCSPNLKRITLEILWDCKCFGRYYAVWKNYSDVLLKNLTELEIDCFHYSDKRKINKEFVKLVEFFLARSPKLENVNIFTIHEKSPGTELLKTLEQSPHRSPTTIITVESGSN